MGEVIHIIAHDLTDFLPNSPASDRGKKVSHLHMNNSSRNEKADRKRSA